MNGLLSCVHAPFSVHSFPPKWQPISLSSCSEFLRFQMLNKKIDTLTKALEAEYKKIKREAAIKEKSPFSTKVNDKMRNTNSSRRYVFTYSYNTDISG